MQNPNSIVAVFTDHANAEAAVKKLAASGFEMSSLSVVGKGYHLDEQVVGFYNADDRIRFWGSRGAIWGGLWGLFFGGIFVTVPVVGPVIMLGYLATTAISVLEGAVVVGGASALGAAIFGIGIPKDSVLQYETDIAADKFLVMAHGSPSKILLAKAILEQENPARIDAPIETDTVLPAEALADATV